MLRLRTYRLTHQFNCDDPLGRGDGTFNVQETYATCDGPLSVEVVDLNGDGKSDLAAATTDDAVSVLLNAKTFPADLVSRVADRTQSLGLHGNAAQSLLAKLDAATAALRRLNNAVARNVLNAAVRELQSLVKARKLDEVLAGSLMADLLAAIGSI